MVEAHVVLMGVKSVNSEGIIVLLVRRNPPNLVTLYISLFSGILDGKGTSSAIVKFDKRSF